MERNNNHQEMEMQKLRDSIITQHSQKEMLMKKLAELNVRIDEHKAHIKYEAGNSQQSESNQTLQLSQQPTQQSQPNVGSPSHVHVATQPSPRKRPYPAEFLKL